MKIILALFFLSIIFSCKKAELKYCWECKKANIHTKQVVRDTIVCDKSELEIQKYENVNKTYYMTISPETLIENMNCTKR